MMKKEPKTCLAVVDIPATSPYYDRLRSLNMQMDFVPYGSPEYHYLDRQICELTERARRRAQTDLSRVADARLLHSYYKSH